MGYDTTLHRQRRKARKFCHCMNGCDIHPGSHYWHVTGKAADDNHIRTIRICERCAKP